MSHQSNDKYLESVKDGIEDAFARKDYGQAKRLIADLNEFGFTTEAGVFTEQLKVVEDESLLQDDISQDSHG